MNEIINNFLQEISENCHIEFSLQNEERENIYSSLKSETKVVTNIININNKRLKVYIDEKHRNSIEVISYLIKNKLQELLKNRAELCIKILAEENVDSSLIYEYAPLLLQSGMAIIISVEKDIMITKEIVDEYFTGEDFISFIYKGDIVVVTANILDDEYIKCIVDLVLENGFTQCYVSYSNFIEGEKSFKTAYEEGINIIEIGKIHHIKNVVLNRNELIFENIVYGLNNKMKNHVKTMFKNFESIFDNEIVNTLEVFFDNNLNISDTSKKLYIHRNTLIYRLDRIEKETGYDVRNFREATFLKIAILIWKEKK